MLVEPAAEAQRRAARRPEARRAAAPPRRRVGPCRSCGPRARAPPSEIERASTRSGAAISSAAPASPTGDSAVGRRRRSPARTRRPSAAQRARGGRVPAEHGALERRRPAGVGPGAREQQPGHRGLVRRAQRRPAGRGAERRGVLARDEEALDARLRARAAAAPRAPAGSARAARRRSSPSPARRPTATPPDTGSRRARRPRRCGRTGTAPACRRPRRSGLAHRPVVDDVQVHDRRALERPQPAARSSRAAARAAPRRARAGPRRSPRRRPARRAAARARAVDAESPLRDALDPLRAPAEPHLDAGRAQRARARARRSSRCSGRRESRCRRRSALDEQPVWKTNAPSASEACAAGRFSVGSAIRSHSAATASGALAVLGEPVAEASARPSAASAGSSRPSAQRRARRAQALGAAQVADSAASAPARCSGAGSAPRRSTTRARAPGCSTGISRRACTSTPCSLPSRASSSR